LTGSEDIRGRKCKIERDFGIQEALLQENWLFDDLSFMGVYDMGDVVPYLCYVEGIRTVGWGPTIHNTLA
jgi:hypothetical protein